MWHIKFNIAVEKYVVGYVFIKQFEMYFVRKYT